MKRKFKKMGLTDALSEDFAWVVECARKNAFFGYGVNELFRSNTCVRDLMELSGHRMEGLIRIAAQIGFLTAAGEKDSVTKKLDDFRKEAVTKGYILAA